MSRKLENVLIDGETYQIGQWPVDKSLEMLTWLTKTLGESFAALANGNIEELMDREISAVIGPALKSLIPRLHENEVKERARDIVDGILCGGKKVVYDVHFMGRIGLLFKVMGEVLKVQYSDFFDALTVTKTRAEALVQEKTTTRAR